MATFTITIGAVTASKTTTNANAMAIITDVMTAQGGGALANIPINGTPQEQLDWFLGMALRRMLGEANAYRRKVVADAAAASAAVDTRDWT